MFKRLSGRAHGRAASSGLARGSIGTLSRRAAILACLLGVASVVVVPAASGSEDRSEEPSVLVHTLDVGSVARTGFRAGSSTEEHGDGVLSVAEMASYEIADPSVYPFVVHGKLFGSYGGQARTCSGTIVTSANESVVLTAAHCLFSTEFRAMVDSVRFAPGYKLFKAPHGYWTGAAVFVPVQWRDSVMAGAPDQRYDFGAVVFERRKDGRSLAELFGSRGIAFNTAPPSFQSFGYPVEPAPFEGERLITCESPAAPRDGSYGHPHLLGMTCVMKQGSSGGGWVTDGGYVASVMSHWKVSRPDVVYGPYLGDDALALYTEASTYGTSAPPVSPDPAAPRTVEVAKHRMVVSMRLRNHLVARGHLVAMDRYDDCSRGAPVRILRSAGGGWKLVKKTRTDERGSFRVKLKDVKGRYIARTPERHLDDRHACTSARSSKQVHRH